MKYKLTEKVPTIEAMSLDCESQQDLEDFIYPHSIHYDYNGEPYLKIIKDTLSDGWESLPHEEFYLTDAFAPSDTFVVKYSDGRLLVVWANDLDNHFDYFEKKEMD